MGRHQSKERLVLQVSLNARYDRFRQLLVVQNLGNKTRALNSQVWRNPLNLFRGAEYLRFQVRCHLIYYVFELLVEVVHGREPLYLGLQAATKKEPLTYYDMNLSAQVIFLREEVIQVFTFSLFQDHQTFFTCEADAG